MDRRELAAIFGGGCVGAPARAAVAYVLPHGAAAWPWGTFLVNVAGAFLLGYFVTRLQERLPISAYRRPFLGTGFCGALTTFSTMEVEVFDMVRAGNATMAAAYVLVSMAAGFLALVLGTAVVRRSWTGR